MPQEWQTNWEQPFDGDENQRQIRVHQLGNLTLLRQALNSRVSNGPWKGANGKVRGAFSGTDSWQ
ncbi:MAG: HNH endonuclease [Ignavibacteria bacterium]|nr:HNH endonuclease [Ignavibacteria bacterium]